MKREMGAQETAICMGWDAFRICVGAEPKTFTLAEIMRWLKLVNNPNRTKDRDNG